MDIQNVQNFEASYTVLLYITLYTVICTHTELLNDIDNVQLLYHVTTALCGGEKKLNERTAPF